MPSLKLCLGCVSGFSSVVGTQLYMGGVSGQEKEYKCGWFAMACFAGEVRGGGRRWLEALGGCSSYCSARPHSLVTKLLFFKINV